MRTFKQVEYARMMAARPQTLYGIAGAVGLAAWLLDHNDADGQPAAAVVYGPDHERHGQTMARDEILDNITLAEPGSLRRVSIGSIRAAFSTPKASRSRWP